MFKPELLSPAGSLEKLKVAILYGADAVYLAGQKYGLRTAADNFTLDEIAEGVAFAHAQRAKAYIVLNAFLHDSDMVGAPDFIAQVSEMGIDGAIVSDLGVIETVRRNSKIPIHLSTQASCLNRYAAQAWRRLGVSRLILGREVSVAAAGEIKKQSGLEVELFIHGSMCMAFSGNCTISSFTRGRDSNRGGCAQSCRFRYSFGDEATSTFMSAKDLNGLECLPLFSEHQIDSVKIEGRMRSPLYVGGVTKVYREALDQLAVEGDLDSHALSRWQRELDLIPHREYSTGNLHGPAQGDSVYLAGPDGTRREFAFLGVIRKLVDTQYAVVESFAGFSEEEPIEVLPFEGRGIPLSGRVWNSWGQSISRTTPNSLIRIPYQKGMEVGQIVRKVVAL